MKTQLIFLGAMLLVACAKPVEDDAPEPLLLEPGASATSRDDAGVVASEASTASPDPDRDGGAEGGVGIECHGVPQEAPVVERVQAALPEAQGGVIVPGVYHLRVQYHTSEVPPSTPERATFRFGASEVDVTLRERPSSEDQRATLSMKRAGASMSLADVCVSSYGSMNLDVLGYTATPTKVTLVGLRTAYELALVR